jgi:hypothetical protein
MAQNNDIIVTIPNFKLDIFQSLIEQALVVGEELIMEFSPDMVRSITYTQTKSFMKLWIINMSELIETPKSDGQLVIPTLDDVIDGKDPKSKVELDFPVFDFYILKGSLIRKFFKVHTSNIVEIQFTLTKTDSSNKYQAKNFSVISESQAFSITKKQNLKTTFPLSTEELMTNKIDDYSKVISKCQPTDDMFEFVLDKTQIQEIKRLIKNLHKISSQNKVYLNFNINVPDRKITVNDSIFTYDIDLPDEFVLPESSFNFNILKSDFIITGNHSFTIYGCDADPRIILGASYLNAIIWAMVTKIPDPDNIETLSEAILDTAIENINEYFSEVDIPF